MAAPRFPYLRKDEETWGWARRVADELNKFNRLWELASTDLTGKAGQTVKVKADETGFELVP